MSKIVQRTGFGVVAAIPALGITEGVAINIPATNADKRQLTVIASLYPINPASPNDMLAAFSRLVAWAGDEPTDDDTSTLDPLSAYYGQMPGRPLLDTMVPATKPFFRELTLTVQPQESLWFYLGIGRDAVTINAITCHISLAVINRDSGTLGTQGLKAV